MRARRPPKDNARYRRGWRIRYQGFGEHGEEALRRLAAVDPGHARAICEFIFGTVWSRPHLSLKTRELIVLGVATALDKPNEVELHARAALRRGATRKEIVETIVQVAPYAGFPVTNHGLLAAQRAFDAAERERDARPSHGRPRRGRPRA
ncbi:MAG TPA: carboxymuconolactone decarboxylase family protein [Candidatus Methylomirabilis sp.]|jgi:4-carboxymuconolactone decarboxylase